MEDSGCVDETASVRNPRPRRNSTTAVACRSRLRPIEPAVRRDQGWSWRAQVHIAGREHRAARNYIKD